MTGRRAQAGRKSEGEILRLRELVDMEVSDAMWGEIIRALAEAAANGEKGAIQAAKLLIAYRYGLPNQFTGHDEAPPIHIRTIEARLSDRKPTRRNRKGGRRVPDAAEPAPGPVAGMADKTAVRRGDGGDAGW